MAESLYIHIPFCIKKCLYCDFLSVPYNESLAEKYTDALCKELILKKNYAGKLKTVYIGGGTPSLLTDDCFNKIFQCLNDNFEFSDFPEITAEANPGTITESKIHALCSLGVNRFSIGTQSLNDAELKTLGRIHSAEDAMKSIEIIRNSGIKNFSIDLIYAIPGQTMETWNKTVSKTVELSPTHISMYELTPEEHTPLFEFIKSGKVFMSDEELILQMYNNAIDYLSDNGFEHYEISNLALSERIEIHPHPNPPPSTTPSTGGRGLGGGGGKSIFKCLHNLNYWDRGEYIGAGAGAHSFINNVRSNNIRDIQKYIESLNQNKIPEIEAVQLSNEDSLKEFIFLGLRKTEGIELSKAQGFGLNLPDAAKDFIENGYLEISSPQHHVDRNLRFTRKGIVVSNTVLADLLKRLGL